MLPMLMAALTRGHTVGYLRNHNEIKASAHRHFRCFLHYSMLKIDFNLFTYARTFLRRLRLMAAFGFSVTAAHTCNTAALCMQMTVSNIDVYAGL